MIARNCLAVNRKRVIASESARISLTKCPNFQMSLSEKTGLNAELVLYRKMKNGQNLRSGRREFHLD